MIDRVLLGRKKEKKKKKENLDVVLASLKRLCAFVF